MSFLIDPPLLLADGYFIGRVSPSSRVERLAEMAVLATFLGYSVGLYRNAEFTRPLWEACRADSGRDWMLNSGITAFDHRNPAPATHTVAAIIFATYPLWLRLGIRLGRRQRASRRRR
jgi:hypothetical protein